jgi:uncharacterized protein
MIRAVYDTNILVSGTVTANSPSAYLIDAWINNTVTLVTSEPIIDEVSRTLEKKYFSSRLTTEQRRSIINLVRSRTFVTPIMKSVPSVATHPEDDIVLATAESGKAEYIVTGDHGLQNLGSFKGIAILTPQILQ